MNTTKEHQRYEEGGRLLLDTTLIYMTANRDTLLSR